MPPSHPAGLLIGETHTIPSPDLMFDEGQVSSPSCGQNSTQDGIHKIHVPGLALDKDQAPSPSFNQNDALDGIDQPPEINIDRRSPLADLEWAVSSEKAPLSATEAIATNEERLDLDVIVHKSPHSILPRNMHQQILRDQVANNYLNASLYPTTIQNTNPTLANGTIAPSTKPLFFPESQPTKAPSEASHESVPARPSFASSVHVNSTSPSLMSVDRSTCLKTESGSLPSRTALPIFAVTSVGVSDMRPLKKAKLFEVSEISDESNDMDIDIGPAVKDEIPITKEQHAATSSAGSVLPEVASANASPAVFGMGSYGFARKPICNNKPRSPEIRKPDAVQVIDLTIDEDCCITPEIENPRSPRTLHTPPAAKLTPEPSLPAPASDTYPASPQDPDPHHVEEPESPSVNGNSDSSELFVDYDPFFDTLRVIAFIHFANE